MDRSKAPTVTVAEGKNRFSAWIRAAEHGASVTVTRHGRPVAVIVSAESYEELCRTRRTDEAGGLAALAGGWDESDAFVDAIDELEREPAPDPVSLE